MPPSPMPPPRSGSEFAFLEDWLDKVGYLIELGRGLPPLPDALKVERHKVRGCQSQVCWWPSLRRRSPMVPKPPKSPTQYPIG